MLLYSHSRISSFEKCPLQYQLRYIQKRRTDTQSIEAFLGNRVHEALEKLYRDLLASRRPSLDEILASYHKTWSENYVPGRILIVKKHFDEQHYRTIGEKCVKDYYVKHSPFDDGTTLGLEERFTVTMDAEGRYQLQGYIDRLVRTDAGAYEIHDYKTSDWVPSDADLRKDRQLTLYQMAVAQRFPEAREIRLVWHYLARGQVRRSERTPEEIDLHRRETVRQIDAIEAAKEFPARVSVLCDWCEYRKEICPQFNPPRQEEPKPTQWLDKAEQIPLFG